MPKSLEQRAQDLARKTQWSLENRLIEADLRSDLFLVLAPYVLDDLGIPPGDVKQEGLGRSGRFDSMFGRAIIEYKRPGLLGSLAERETAARQALDYLEDPALAAQVVIVTDGEIWGFLRDADAGPELGEQGWFSFPVLIQRTPAERFAWHPNSEDAAYRVLQLLSTLKSAPVTAANVASRLGLARPEVKEFVALLADRLHNREPDGRIDVLFQEWIQLAGVAYGIQTADDQFPSNPEMMLGPVLGPVLGGLTYPEAIFTLHTYVSFASKIVACEVLALIAANPGERPTGWLGSTSLQLARKLNELEGGTLTEFLRAPGLFGNDVFGWYAANLSLDEELAAGARGVLHAVSELAWARVANAGSVALDLLRHLYQDIVPRMFRKALGEFFTPRWVAERVLSQGLEFLGEVVAPRILDPSCGSGTFLVAALSRELGVIESAGGASEDEILDLTKRIIGFDINPVSALMTRVSLLLALGDRAQRLSSISFSVFQTDSILLPDVVRGATQLEIFSTSDNTVNVPTSVGNFGIAASLATAQGISILRNAVEISIANQRSPERFRTRLRSDLGELCSAENLDEVLRISTDFYSRVSELNDQGKNGVWGRIVEQALAPLFIEPVDLVVGNPPWISWKDLPPGWKERSEPTWRQWGLWQEGRGRRTVPLSDISTLLVSRSVATYAPTGVIAMLLPESALIADPGGRALRRCDLRPAHLGLDEIEGSWQYAPLGVDDFSDLNPFSPDASNKPIALYFRAGQRPVFPFFQTSWKRRSRGTRLHAAESWSIVEPLLEGEIFAAEPIDISDPGSPWAKANSSDGLRILRRGEPRAYSWGRGFETRGLDGVFFCEVLTSRPSGSQKLVRIRSHPEQGGNTRNDPVREGEIEAKFLWPLVKGENVQRWKILTSGLHCIVVHASSDPTHVYSIDELAGGDGPHLFDYLEPWIDRLGQRSMYREQGNLERPWALSGPIVHLHSTEYVVASRYIAGGSRPAAAVMSPKYRDELGRTTIALPNNKLNVFFTPNEDEAYYLASWINSIPAQEQISRFASSTGITPRVLECLPIPKFEPTNAIHLRLSELGKLAAESVDADGNVQPDIEVGISEIVHRIAR